MGVSIKLDDHRTRAADPRGYRFGNLQVAVFQITVRDHASNPIRRRLIHDEERTRICTNHTNLHEKKQKSGS
jgi:hypothetical protein